MKNVLNEYIDKVFDQLVADTQEFISIESTLDEETAEIMAPFGKGIQKALEYILEKADFMGFSTKNLDGYAGYAQLGDTGDLVAILAHVDVVPAVGDWGVPPYSAQIIDGKLYGRGSVDDKGPAIACLYAMKAIKECNLPFTKRARLLLGTDEETLARGIYYYLDRDETPACGFSPDAEFPIIHAEKGTIRFQYNLPPADSDILVVDAGTRLNVVPDYAFAKLHGITEEQVISCANDLTLKARISTQKDGDDINIEVFGVASHASYPEGGINAVQNLFLLLKNLYPKPNSALKKSIHALADVLKVETNGLSAGLFCTDEVSGELTLNTAILKIDKENHFCKFDIRYPVTHDGEELLKKLELLATECFANYKLIQHKPPLYVEKDRPFIKELQKAYEESTGEPANCISIGGGTYCRYVKNTVSFGPVFPGQKELAHQSNEYISLDDLRKIAKIYAQAIYNLIK